MAEENLQKKYREVQQDFFPTELEFTFKGEVWDAEKEKMVSAEAQTLFYEKARWDVKNPETGEMERMGLRYGENPGQQASLYKLVNGNLVVGDVQTIQPGKWLASNTELLQSGKHPGKTNITDADNGMNILRYFMGEPLVAIFKHNNPCGVAIGDSLLDAYVKANMADRVAAFGGAIALNRAVDRETAEAIVENYSEVVVAPEFEEGVMGIFERKKDLRVMRIGNMAGLKQWVGERVVEFKSLMDGGLIAQVSYSPNATTIEDIAKLPVGYQNMGDGKKYKIERAPTAEEVKDMWFGWLVESGVTSNSVIYVKNGVTVGIGTGEQDRVGVAKIAREKAYEKLRDAICFKKFGMPYNNLLLKVENTDCAEGRKTLEDSKRLIEEEVQNSKGGLEGAVMVSDAFFPFRDGADVGLREGIRAIIQPGGSKNDYQSIEACNEAGATMLYTEQRSFKH